MRTRIQPYKTHSQAARELSKATGYKRVRLVRTRFVPRPGDRIINWGSQEVLFPHDVYVNHPRAVANATNKLIAYRIMKEDGVSVPDFTTDYREAQKWADDGKIVVCRSLLRASAGRGIGLVGKEIEDGTHTGVVPRGDPLYTLYVPKYDEYRVHVWDGQVIDIQQKRRRQNHEREVDQRIRNAAGGWVFCREEIKCPPVVVEQALRAVRSLGLDFGAADVGFTRKSSTACVYEVNTAPGLEGTTVRRYARAAIAT